MSRLVRGRLNLQLMAIVVLLVVTGLGLRACSAPSPASSPGNPVDIARNGLATLCAEQQALAASGNQAPSGYVLSPAQLRQLQADDPAGLQALQQAAGGSLACPTTTLPGG
jgi:hypothetical protein